MNSTRDPHGLRKEEDAHTGRKSEM